MRGESKKVAESLERLREINTAEAEIEEEVSAQRQPYARVRS
jgi:hypothetical protein